MTKNTTTPDTTTVTTNASPFTSREFTNLASAMVRTGRGATVALGAFAYAVATSEHVGRGKPGIRVTVDGAAHLILTLADVYRLAGVNPNTGKRALRLAVLGIESGATVWSEVNRHILHSTVSAMFSGQATLAEGVTPEQVIAQCVALANPVETDETPDETPAETPTDETPADGESADVGGGSAPVEIILPASLGKRLDMVEAILAGIRVEDLASADTTDRLATILGTIEGYLSTPNDVVRSA